MAPREREPREGPRAWPRERQGAPRARVPAGAKYHWATAPDTVNTCSRGEREEEGQRSCMADAHLYSCRPQQSTCKGELY